MNEGMLLRMQKIGVVIGAMVMGVLGLLWFAEWMIWALWILPGIVGLYLWLRSGRPEQALRDHYLGMAVLACTWPWGWSLGEYVLPALSRLGQRLMSIPFTDSETHGGFDVSLPLLAILLSLAGYVGLVLAVAQQVSAPRPTYEVRIRVFRIVGAVGIALGAAGLMLTGHPIVTGVLVLIGMFATWAFSRIPEDPANRIAEIRARKARSY